ncbi:hypothetical protein [Mesorhizobium sp. WSM3860]|uniref:hypothetical protein n=1 Tax=Mesorhizobium sp. WSM3860 TaxID=2029403 RepID=UPI000BB09F36|nr:hypothetical protein [Mesorhizobium sp. WSM3860]PBC03666.1 hypothetical protein CK220_13930 [Mesorhizobium sp. WSM3860]
MAGSVTDWVEAHIDEDAGFKAVGRSAENFLLIEDDKKAVHPVAVIGAKPMVQVADVEPVLAHAIKPEFVINIPSRSIWTGSAIDLVHAAPAGFGSLGDLGKAVRLGDLVGYRNKEFGFFERAIGQHSNVHQLTRLYDLVFIAHRKKGSDLTIALIDAYNLSAEDVRHARAQYGAFDIALKMSSYGSVTSAAQEAARSMGAEAMMFRDIMGRLGR